ncbi:MAG: hypothetical protein ACTHK8_21550 [Ginsengibacter sp.]
MKVQKLIKKALKPYVPKIILRKRKLTLQKKQLLEWHYAGCENPPPNAVKQITIAYYQSKYSIPILIETGTYLGDMVEAQKNRFSKIITIELSEKLFHDAKNRFSKDENIIVMHGDSGKVLYEVLKDIKSPAIFWLDGHFSGGITVKGDKECPIFEEINAIFTTSNYNHILLIDDARLFVGQGGYPTIDELTKHIKTKNVKYQEEVKNDIIRYSI